LNYAPDDSFSYDYTVQLRNTQSDTHNKAILHAHGGAAYIYLGSVRPLDGFKLYIETANTSTSAMSIYYYNGSAWTTVSSISDGTSSGGKSLAQTGNVTFDSTVDIATIGYIDGVKVYWYRIVVDVVTANTALYQATLSAPFQEVKDIWDGEPRLIDNCQLYEDSTFNDYTSHVREATGTTYLELDDMGGTSNYFICGFAERITGVAISIMPHHNNTQSTSVLYAYYWNGTAWTSVGTLKDGTTENSVILAKSGVVAWNPISYENEFEKSIEKDIKLYYYKFLVGTAALSDDVQVYQITGIPAQKELSQYKFPLLANDRLWLCCNSKGKKNTAIYSAAESSSIFNGDDSSEWKFGDESELMGGSWLYSQYGSSLYNLTIFFKKNETWALVGNDPESWVKYKISDTIGCVAPGTIKNIDLGPETKLPNRNIVVWQGTNGVYFSDGRSPINIAKDIIDKFDKRLSTSINTSEIANSEATWDNDNKCYHWLWASGSSTSLNEEWVFDFTKMAWFEIERTTSKQLQLCIEVEDSSGNLYNYGFIDTGYMERLEYGNDFDGEDITHTLQFGDIALAEGSIATETTAEYSSLIAIAKTTTSANISLTHYGDGKSSGTSWTESPQKSGHRIIYPVEHKSLGAYVFHSYKLVIITNDEVIGFEPLYFYILYSTTRDHLKDYR
jgi:hypothetical protein